MNDKLMLTSLLAISVASPAMAVSWNTAAGPKQDLMEKNTTYDNAATYLHMGTSANNSTAEAAAYYRISPGYYLPANSYTAAICTANYYCSGTTEDVTKSSSIQGRTQCPTGYSNSDSGSDSMADCYTSCPAAGSNSTAIAHMATGATITGRVYYGNLNNCSVSACEPGYDPMNVNVASEFGNQTSSDVHLADSAVDSSAWLVSFTAGDLGGGWACKAGNYWEAEPVTRAELESMTTGSTCYCWINKVNGKDASSLAVPVTRDVGTCSTSCKEACANAVGGGSNNNDSAFDRGALFEYASNTSACVGSNYTIRYRCSEISSTYLGSQRVIFNEDVTTWARNPNTCSREGYTFANAWLVSGTNDELAADSVVKYNYVGDKTFTGKWTPNENTITLNASGATGGKIQNKSLTNGAVTFTCYTDAAITPPTWNATDSTTTTSITKAHSVFLGWSTDSSCTSSDCVNMPATCPTSDKTYYAVWSPCADPTAGTGVDSAVFSTVEGNVCQYLHTCGNGYYSANNNVNVPDTTMNCSTCPAGASGSDNGRNEQADCFYTCPGKTVTNASSVTPVNAKEYYSGSAYPTCTYNASCDSGYTVANNLTANPVCGGNSITLTWANGGHGSTESIALTSCTYGETFTMPAALTHTGWTFKNWIVDKVPGKTFNGGQQSVICNSANLGVTSGSSSFTADWTANTIKILWNGIENASVTTADGKAMSNFNGTNFTAESQVLYDGDIPTPQAARAPTGQEFVGWKFIK